MSVYLKDSTYDNVEQVQLLGSLLRQLVDFSTVPQAIRRDASLDTICHLFDIFGRIELPQLEDIPDSLKADWFDTPIWKSILLLFLIGFTALLIVLLNKWLKQQIPK
ncbi:MAG: hypothetical protein L3J71_15050 [Victivallaceae bacterium]|nr:hypothetical protein [Victivallaceae bacterium]